MLPEVVSNNLELFEVAAALACGASLVAVGDYLFGKLRARRDAKTTPPKIQEIYKNEGLR